MIDRQATESIVILEDDDVEEDEDRLMSKEFKMEELIKDQYRAKLSSVLIDTSKQHHPEESKNEA